MARVTISKSAFDTTVRRNEWFASRGYRVLRFTNNDVMKNLEGVVLSILQAAEQAAPLSLTLPRKGEGNPSADASLTYARDAEEQP